METANKYIREYQSFSSFNTWVRCAMQYEWRYLKRVKIPPGVALVEGSTGHKALEFNYVQKVSSQVDLPVDDVLDVVSDEWESRKVEVEDWEGKKPGDLKDRLVKTVKKYQKSHAPEIQPVEVESRYDIVVEGVKMRLYMDLVDKSPKIRDTKFVEKTRSQNEVDADMQLTIYSYAKGLPFVSMDCVVKSDKNPRVNVIESRRGDRDFERLEHRIPLYTKSIQTGIFPPADISWWGCSKKWCGFWAICEGGGKRTGRKIFDIKNTTLKEML